MASLRAADSTLVHAVVETLRALALDERDGAAGRLALAYAQQIDADPDLLAALGPKLQALLNDLLATPASRAKSKAPGTAEVPGAGTLAALRGGAAA